jgi:RNA polymerase sigma factor for flagellar operon FliA
MLPPIPPLDDRSQLIRDHMPLVELVVQRMVPQVPSFMTREDMTSAAMVGLIDAANKYDPGKGAKFKTFAEYRVRGAILDEMRKLDWFSRSMRDKQTQLTQTMLRLERQLGRSPEDTEMAAALNLGLNEYHTLLGEVSHLGCVSLHETLDHTEVARILADILEELGEKERLVVALYYYEELTQKEIAEVLGVSEGRVSQLHSQALVKLRVKLINSDLYQP